MQFLANGPDIPDTLLEAHEDGRVVFFCGAGISVGAGLPLFRGLVDRVYAHTETTQTEEEQISYNEGRYDLTLGMLERRLPGHSSELRQALFGALRPNTRRKHALSVHKAITLLSHDRRGTQRLVTTNYDDLFDRAARRLGTHIRSHAAPMLPPPKTSRWSGVAHIHGKLPRANNPDDLIHLVLTSGDFGLAYLTEGWAARFASDLFRHFTVCFLGYGINDIVLRYMLDALSADRMHGEETPQAFAFAECKPGDEDAQLAQWRTKGVHPILYRVHNGETGHTALRESLTAWAGIYRDGISGRERIVTDCAQTRPSHSTEEDDLAGRLLWALSERTGVPAQRFADAEPSPSLEWLEIFCQQRYGEHDLKRFGLASPSPLESSFRFSLASRPAPITHGTWMAVAGAADTEPATDPCMYQLARWLTRHLDNPKLLLWVAKSGGSVYAPWKRLIERALRNFKELETAENSATLEAIRKHSPDAIPSLRMRLFWGLLIAGFFKSHSRYDGLADALAELAQEGATSSVRTRLRSALSPRLVVREPVRWARPEALTGPGTPDGEERIEWELSLAANCPRADLQKPGEPPLSQLLPPLLGEFELLLERALDLMRQLDAADDRHDRSSWELPSISPHWQNRGFSDWVLLVELTRDAWLALLANSPKRAQTAARSWSTKPYPTFRRLSLFAATRCDDICPPEWTAWILSDDSWWLWSTQTQRETLRLIVLRGQELSPQLREQIESAILEGPPRALFRDEIDDEVYRQIVERATWLRLSKLASATNLGARARSTLDGLSAKHPTWKLASDERDEFSSWMSGTGDPDYEESREIHFAPTDPEELVAWLRAYKPRGQLLSEDNWRDLCRSDPDLSIRALGTLAVEGDWPLHWWTEALGAWITDESLKRSWESGAELVERMPDEALATLAHQVSMWAEGASKVSTENEDLLIALTQRLIYLPLPPESGISRNGQPLDQPISEAINHPIGHATRILMHIWFRRRPRDGSKLESDLSPLITKISEDHNSRFRHGRVILFQQLIALYRTDPDWTREHLLPRLDWRSDPIEARAAWEGFLWGGRLYRPLASEFSEQFLSTASHYSRLTETRQQYARLLTVLATDNVSGYSSELLRSAFAELPEEALATSLHTLVDLLDGSGNQRKEFWTNRVIPFWANVWPKSDDVATEPVADSLARLCVASGTEFPNALRRVRGWLKPIQHPDFVVHLLDESGLTEEFPEPALELLSLIIDSQPWPPRDLEHCLAAIKAATPNLERSPTFRRLTEYLRSKRG